jgi:hypothetical protein
MWGEIKKNLPEDEERYGVGIRDEWKIVKLKEPEECQLFDIQRRIRLWRKN